uniref:Dynein assembly factor 3, axonemal homolog n=1 Tax=Clastoptera arizonana TaxID=38151 RepID=A0A1B6CBW1_9HEMI
MLWGFSPALDILNEIKDVPSVYNKDELNILIIGSADGRHILKTISKYYTHPRKRIHFYVSEVLLDFIARQMLLVLIALEPSEELGLFEKTRLWMELYGNSLLRPTTRNYLTKKAAQLIHMVTDLEYLDFRLSVVNLRYMKYKERDGLETIFQFWLGKQSFNSVQLWDNRLRQSLGVRYDTRDGVFDWDYHMKLKDIPGGKSVNIREYKYWRNSGVAFTWLETTPSEDNLTFGSGIAKLGDRIVHHGYLGDIVSSPYINFGVLCEDEEMMKERNGIRTQRATDISERNLMRLFHEIEKKEKYTHKGKGDLELGAVITELAEIDLEKLEEIQEEKPKPDVKRKDDYSAMTITQTKVFFLPIDALKDCKPKFKDFFDVVVFSQNLAQRLTPDVMCLAKDGAVLLAETRKYLTTLKAKEKDQFSEYLKSLAKESHCEPLHQVNGNTDDYAKFRVKRK